MKKIGLFILASLACQSAFAGFELNKSIPIAVGKELIDNNACTGGGIFDKCPVGDVLYTTKVTIPAEYSTGTNSKIEINVDFKNVANKFALRIRGEDHLLTNDANQSFALPAGSTGEIELAIVSKAISPLRLVLPHWSYVRSITVSLDGMNYVQSVINTLDGQVTGIQTAQGNYKSAKKYLEWFSKDHDKVCELKEELTGRDCADMSNSCLVNGAEESDVLGPDACQKLQIFNRILSGASTNETEKEKADAFKIFSDLVTKYVNDLQLIADAGQAVDQMYIQSRVTFLTFLNAEKPKDTTTPTPTAN